nr:ribosomal protein S9 [Ostreobium sp. TRHA14-720]
MIISLGRRKTATAKVKLFPGSGKAMINGKDINVYLQGNIAYKSIIYKPFESLGLKNSYDIIAHVQGSGQKGQIGAIRLAVAKALSGLNSSYKKPLKSRGYLTRDSRSKERRKYGLKKARKAPQFSKR